MKLLFVDDEPDHEILIRQFLENAPEIAGCELAFASDGQQALDLIRRDPAIEVLVSDIKMPRMDGLTLLGHITRDHKGLCSVIISAYGDMTNIRTAMNQGAFDFLIKPIDLNDLKITVTRAIENVRRAKAAARENERLETEIIETQKEIIYKLSELVEMRSQETGNHVRRVSEYCRLLALYKGMPVEEADKLRLAAPMHDIGKVAIPDSILHKHGALSAEEWIIMRTHAEVGYNLFKDSSREFLRCAAIIAHEHHEKYDGSGYPQGLRGENIHIYARIMAVADVFDALGSKRAYKEPWPMPRILEHMRSQKGIHFDPELVDLLEKNMNEISRVRLLYPD
ncbi:MAG: response regulator [Leptospirales bacterium]|nr:response regulator [Leptospirales bacterium]